MKKSYVWYLLSTMIRTEKKVGKCCKDLHGGRDMGYDYQIEYQRHVDAVNN